MRCQLVVSEGPHSLYLVNAGTVSVNDGSTAKKVGEKGSDSRVAL